MNKIPKRLEAISSLIPINANVLDVGCDHALLDIYLYQNKISNNIVASDINQNALNNAIENIKKNHLENMIETRLGNGLDVLKAEDNIDTVVISGMGSHTIIGILKNNLKKLKNINNLIIQSNTDLKFLRKEITKLHYKILDELIIEEDEKKYIIIKFVKGYKKYTERELYFGPVLLEKNEKLFQKYNEEELDKLNLLLKLIPKDHFKEGYKIMKKIKLYKK